MPALDALPQIAANVDRLRQENERLTAENEGLLRQIRALAPVVAAAEDVVDAVSPPRGGPPSAVGLKVTLNRLETQVLRYRRGRPCST